MTANLIPIYGCAALSILALSVLAWQNRRSGWKRERPASITEALHDFYIDLGIAVEEQTPTVPMRWEPVTAEEEIGFSAQMLKLRAALGNSAPVTQEVPDHARELVHK